MAKVEKTEVVKLVEVTEPGVTLALTLDEVEVLQVVLARVGGQPAITARGIVQEIFFALREQGFDYRSSEHNERVTGSIEFF